MSSDSDILKKILNNIATIKANIPRIRYKTEQKTARLFIEAVLNGVEIPTKTTSKEAGVKFNMDEEIAYMLTNEESELIHEYVSCRVKQREDREKKGKARRGLSKYTSMLEEDITNKLEDKELVMNIIKYDYVVPSDVYTMLEKNRVGIVFGKGLLDNEK
ncbi:hypothetical protein [Listeria phage LP-KV022]|uniref:Uncharacterized protein n=3 Tax=Homburgvirus TaxID=1921125 RepID=A0A6C0QZT9_9CAUD|nr:hypothetical protein LP110_003 [Listeria phage LP-110]AGI11506.1 hypothetical protein LP110_003 [Listeria phage LP-110]AWY07697.1 hypothetical protein [Listeria phage LP-KV022]QHZ59391.1 hypothetical protein FK483_0048 [Listeria phage LP-018]